MGKRILSNELTEHIGKTITVQGWLHNVRKLGGMTFIILRDRKGLIQILDEKSTEIKKLRNMQNGTILTVVGKVVEDKRAVAGAELHEPNITVDVPVEYVLPIEIDKDIDHKPENHDTLFEYRVLGLRNVKERNIFKIQAAVGDSARSFLQEHDFVEFHSPKLLAGATEGGAEVFKLDYFGQEATLAQSAQFYKQIMVGVFERVFEFGATYRAEPSFTTRHMSEYITIDGEMGFISSFQDLLDLLSGLLNRITEDIWSRYGAELLELKAKPIRLTKALPQIPMQELHELYFKETGEDTRKEKDPTPAEERFICDYAAKHWGSEAVFITEFPASEMKFYHFRSETNPQVAERADLIFRGVEIVTGSQREHRYPKLVEQLKAMGGNPDHPGYKYYLQAFRHGLPPHAGFGLGLERLTQKIIGLGSVKEATLFPRDVRRLAP